MYRNKKRLTDKLQVDEQVISDINRISKELKSLWFYQKARKRELLAELAMLKQIVKEAVQKANK